MHALLGATNKVSVLKDKRGAQCVHTSPPTYASGSAAPDVHALLGVASESKNAKCRLHKVAQRYALSTRYVV